MKSLTLLKNVMFVELLLMIKISPILFTELLIDIQGKEAYLYFHCAMEGKKLDLIAKDNRVTFEMDCDHNFILYEERMSCTMGYESVIGHGVIETVPDENKYESLKILMRQYHAEDFKFNTDMMRVTTVLKMTVIDMVGKRRNNIH